MRSSQSGEEWVYAEQSWGKLAFARRWPKVVSAGHGFGEIERLSRYGLSAPCRRLRRPDAGQTSIGPRTSVLSSLMACAIVFGLHTGAREANAQSGGIGIVERRDTHDRPVVGAEGLCVPVAFNGQQRLFIVDTGASVSVFDNSLRNELGELAASKPAETGAGKLTVELFKPPRTSILGHRVEGIAAIACLDLAWFRAGSGHQVYGAVGMDVLRRRIVRIDFDAAEFGFLDRVPEDSGASVPLTLSPLGPMVKVAIDGAGQLPFLIDTGRLGRASGNVDRAVMRQLLDNGDAQVIGPGPSQTLKGTRVVDTVRLKTIAIGDFIHRRAVFDEGDRNSLGLTYLSRYVVTFDFPGETMYLKPGKTFRDPSLYNLSGAQVWRSDGAVVVRSVNRYSAAENAGVEPRDVLQAIDGQPAESLTLSEVRRMFCLPGEHLLRVKRGERTFEIRLMLKELPDPWAEIVDREGPSARLRRIK